MGRIRREKLKRREEFKKSLLPMPPAYKIYGPAVLIVVGVTFLVPYGLGAIAYSRFQPSLNAHIHPVLHPQGIVIGLLLMGVAVWLRKKFA